MNISLIGAISMRNVAGIKGRLPWELSEDLHYFKMKTFGCPIIMGRKTYESIGKPLDGRQNIVLSKTKIKDSEIITATSLEDALLKSKKNQEVFIIGGERPWIEAMNMANKIYLTVIDADYIGDVFFPKVDLKEWTEIRKETFFSKQTNSEYSFIEYSRTLYSNK